MAYQISRRNPGGGGEEDGGSTFVIEDSTSQLVSVAARLFSRALQARFAEHNVSAGQWPLLLYLWEQDGLSQKQLARRVQNAVEHLGIECVFLFWTVHSDMCDSLANVHDHTVGQFDSPCSLVGCGSLARSDSALRLSKEAQS